eukprot:TRINITY_DN62067_c0_g1_i2.p1 TRINITY_DN62067_c0_g1~~TRINITY_DN62067_c0_g1_i2.p1  ORF type:complete len:189 (+),score=51.82 TRINITY_DN62067_c0_g1_i2:97-663(+)
MASRTAAEAPHVRAQRRAQAISKPVAERERLPKVHPLTCAFPEAVDKCPESIPEAIKFPTVLLSPGQCSQASTALEHVAFSRLSSEDEGHERESAASSQLSKELEVEQVVKSMDSADGNNRPKPFDEREHETRLAASFAPWDASWEVAEALAEEAGCERDAAHEDYLAAVDALERRWEVAEVLAGRLA